MGVLVDWDDTAKTSIRLDFEGRWTWDELERAVPDCVNLAKSVDYRINVMVNLGHSGPLPLGIIPHSRKIFVQFKPYMNLLFIVNGDAFANMMVVVFQKVYPKLGADIRVSASLERARRLICDEQQDSAAH